MNQLEIAIQNVVYIHQNQQYQGQA